MTLERIEHKIFASEAPLEEMGQFGSALATTKLNTKDVAKIQALPAYTKGWGSAIISENNYPAMEEMNGVLNVMSYHTGYLYQEGIPTYSATQEYSATSWVKDLAGEKVYKSLQNKNVGHSLTDTSWWVEVLGNNVYVKKSGDTMTGNLTIQKSDPRLYIDSKDITQGEVPATTEYSTLMFRDKNQKVLGQLNIGYNHDGSKGLNLTAYSSDGSVNSSLRIGYDKNDNVYTGAPTPPTGDNTTKIATTAWVNSNAVNVTGDTMTGTLTSTANNGSEIHIKGVGNNNWLTIKGTVSNYDYNDYANVPTETLRNLRLISYDKNNQYYFYQQVSAETARNICAFQVKRKLTNGTEKTCSFALRVQDTGANTLLINGKPLQAFVTETYASGTSWYRVYSDGWCEQGGIYTSSTAGAQTITFLKNFKDTNYYFCGAKISEYNASGNSTHEYVYRTSNAIYADSQTVNSAVVNMYSDTKFNWEAKGYIA